MPLLLFLGIVGCASTQELKKAQSEIYDKDQQIQKLLAQKKELEENISLIQSSDARAQNILNYKKENSLLKKELTEIKSKLDEKEDLLKDLNNDLNKEISEIDKLKKETKTKNSLIEDLKNKIELLSNPLSIAALEDWYLAQKLQGSIIVAQDDEQTYLGMIDFTNTNSESIFNEYGTYGSEFSSTSIWNEFSTFGSEFSSCSPFNEFTSTPPMIIKNRAIIGHLTKNEFVMAAVQVEKVKSLYKRLNE